MKGFNLTKSLMFANKGFQQCSLRSFQNYPIRHDFSFNPHPESNKCKSMIPILAGSAIGALLGYVIGRWKDITINPKFTRLKKSRIPNMCPMREKLSLAPVLLNSHPAVVCVRMIKNNVVISEQSGFIVDHTGLTMTTGMDTSLFDTISIKTQDGRTFPASILEYDTASGLCLLKLSFPSPTYFHSLVLSSKLDTPCRAGDFVISLGASNNDNSNHFSFGIIRTPKKEESSLNPCLVSEMTAIDDFTPGGPLVNMYGKVVGVNKTGSNSEISSQISIPIESGRHLLDRIKKSQIDYSFANNQMIIVSDKMQIDNDNKLKNFHRETFFR